MKDKLIKLLDALKVSLRDIVLAGIAAGVGYIAGRELPKTAVELRALLIGGLYAGLRVAVALGAAKLSALLKK